MPRRHVLLALLVAVVWGVNFVAIHVGLRTFPPLEFAALRFAVIAFPAVLFVRRPEIPTRFIVGIGVFLSAGQFGLLFVAMHEGLSPGLASLVVQLQAVFTIGLAMGLLGERPGRLQLAGAAVALAGIAVIAGGRAQGVPLGALALGITGAFSWAVGNVITRQARSPQPIPLLVWTSLIPPIPLALLSLWLEGPQRMADGITGIDASAVAALAYVAIGASGVGYGIWTWLLHKHPASQVSPYALLVPVVGIAAAWIGLNEQPGAVELAGAAVVLLGLGLITGVLRPGGSRIAPELGTGEFASVRGAAERAERVV